MDNTKATQLSIKVRLEPEGTATEFNAAIDKLQKTDSLNRLRIGVVPNKNSLAKLRSEINHTFSEIRDNPFEIPISTDKLTESIQNAIRKAVEIKGLKLEINTEILGSLQKLTAPIEGLFSDSLFKTKEAVEAELASIKEMLSESEKLAQRNATQGNRLKDKRFLLQASGNDTSEIDAQIKELTLKEKARQNTYKELRKKEKAASDWLKEQTAENPIEANLKATSTSLKNISDSLVGIHSANQALTEYSQTLRSLDGTEKELPEIKTSFDEKTISEKAASLKKYSDSVTSIVSAEEKLHQSSGDIHNDFNMRANAFDNATSALSAYRTELEKVQSMEHGVVEVVKEKAPEPAPSGTGSPAKQVKRRTRKKKQDEPLAETIQNVLSETPQFDVAKDFLEVKKSIAPVKGAVHGLSAEYDKLSQIVSASSKELDANGKVSNETIAAYQKQRNVLTQLSEEAEKKVSVYRSLDAAYKELSSYAGIEYTENFKGQADFLDSLSRVRTLFQKSGTRLIDWNLDELTEAKSLLSQIGRMETDITAGARQDKRLTAYVKSIAAEELATPKQDVSKYSKYISGLSAAYQNYESALIQVRKEIEQGKSASDDSNASLKQTKETLDALLDTARKKSELSKAFSLGEKQLSEIEHINLDDLIISPKADFNLDSVKENINAASAMFSSGKSFVDWDLEETKQFLSLIERINGQFAQMRSRESYLESRDNFLSQAADLAQYAQTPSVAKLDTSEAEDLRSKLQEIAKLRADLSQSSSVNLDYADIERAEQLLKEIEPLQKRVASQSKDFRQIENEARKLANLGSRMDAYLDLNDNVRTNKELYETFVQLRQAVESGAISFSEADKQFAAWKLQCEQAGVATQSFSARLSKLFDEHLKTAIAMFSLHLLQNSFQEMYRNVVEIDAAMVELKKVTSETSATYDRFLTNAGIRARNLGTTIADVVNSSADFARLGYTINEAAELADTAIIYKNVGDGIADIGDASESVISTMKAFGIQAKDSMSIVDKFNETGNSFAISSKGVGDALMRSASALAAAGNTLDESIALVTAANAVIQDPDSVGTTMKTVSMRIRGMKTELEAAGEETETMAETTSQLQEKLLALSGVDIMVDQDNFKSTIQILKELGAAWTDMTDAARAAALELLAGKRNGNVVQAIIDNVELLDQVTETSMNSAGSALKENETYLDSINGKVAQFMATFEEISTSIINSEFVKGVVDSGSGILGFLNNVIQTLNAIPSIAGVAFGALATKDIGYYNENALPYSLSTAA